MVLLRKCQILNDSLSMLNITIQNDGKIKILSECSNTKEMRSNVNLLLAVVSSMETEEAAANTAVKYSFKKSKRKLRMQLPPISTMI